LCGEQQRQVEAAVANVDVRRSEARAAPVNDAGQPLARPQEVEVLIVAVGKAPCVGLRSSRISATGTPPDVRSRRVRRPPSICRARATTRTWRRPPRWHRPRECARAVCAIWRSQWSRSRGISKTRPGTRVINSAGPPAAASVVDPIRRGAGTSLRSSAVRTAASAGD
jgi:hypothetical protein